MSATKSALIAASLFLLAACHGYVAPRDLLENCPNIRKSYDLTLCWKIARSAAGFTITGYAVNTRFSYIEGLELTATILDEQGRTLGEATNFFIPNLIAMDDTAPYSMAVPLRAEEKPARIKFFYRYGLTKLDNGGTPNFSSFETDIAE